MLHEQQPGSDSQKDCCICNGLFFTILYKTLLLLFTWLWYLIAIAKSNTIIKDSM